MTRLATIGAPSVALQRAFGDDGASRQPVESPVSESHGRGDQDARDDETRDGHGGGRCALCLRALELPWHDNMRVARRSTTEENKK